MSKSIGCLYHPVNMEPVKVYKGFSFPSLFFGFCWYLYKGIWSWAVISLTVSIATCGIAWFVFPFFANRQHYNMLRKKGYLTSDEAGTNMRITQSSISPNDLPQVESQSIVIQETSQVQSSQEHSTHSKFDAKAALLTKKDDPISMVGCLSILVITWLLILLNSASPLLCKVLCIVITLIGLLMFIGGFIKPTEEEAIKQNKSIETLTKDGKIARKLGGWAMVIGIIVFCSTLHGVNTQDSTTDLPAASSPATKATAGSEITISGETGDVITTPPAKTTLSPEAPSETNDVVRNSEWDGAVSQVVTWLRKNLKDPRSLEFIEWSPVHKNEDGGYMVRTKYRAKNSFGGYVIEHQIFYLDSNGNVINYVDWE